MKSYFEIERDRNKMALENKLTELKESYVKNYREIKNLNNRKFWDQLILEDRDTLNNYPMYKDKLKVVSKYFQNKKGRLLDIGFGWASFEKCISKNKCLEIHGVDISSEAVKYAKDNLRGNYKTGSVFSLRYPRKQFDYVVLLDVLEHISPRKIFSAYKSISSVLKSTGKIVVTIPINEELELLTKQGRNRVGHVRVYTPELLEAELNIAGFQVESRKYFYAFNNLYSIKKCIMNISPLKFRKPNLFMLVAKKI